ncbi:MAG: L,D-transpeptidase family protein [Pseudomonadota bacterium]
MRTLRTADLPDLRITADNVALFGEDRFPCAIGFGGRGDKQREGDGVTPLGRRRIHAVFYRPDRQPPPVTSSPAIALRPTDGWCDDANDRRYDQLIARPFRASHETLWRADGLYDIVCPLDWRASTPGGGSAIFLHCARDDFRPTAGCVALRTEDLLSALKAMGPRDGVVVSR